MCSPSHVAKPGGKRATVQACSGLGRHAWLFSGAQMMRGSHLGRHT